MRINVYAEELPELDYSRAVAVVEKTADTGRVFYGARLFLESPSSLHDEPGDDDRSAVTIWGPREKVATLLRMLADRMAMAGGRTINTGT